MRNKKAAAAPAKMVQHLATALVAITARIEGEFDNPALVAFGPLMPNTDADVLRIAGAALKQGPERGTDSEWQVMCPFCLGTYPDHEDDCDRCKCGAPTDDGEGWDGKCGNCADREYSKGEDK
jgi:hypothetical protein